MGQAVKTTGATNVPRIIRLQNAASLSRRQLIRTEHIIADSIICPLSASEFIARIIWGDAPFQQTLSMTHD
jgi:hypothetical protein